MFTYNLEKTGDVLHYLIYTNESPYWRIDVTQDKTLGIFELSHMDVFGNLIAKESTESFSIRKIVKDLNGEGDDAWINNVGINRESLHFFFYFLFQKFTGSSFTKVVKFSELTEMQTDFCMKYFRLPNECSIETISLTYNPDGLCKIYNILDKAAREQLLECTVDLLQTVKDEKSVERIKNRLQESNDVVYYKQDETKDVFNIGFSKFEMLNSIFEINFKNSMNYAFNITYTLKESEFEPELDKEVIDTIMENSFTIPNEKIENVTIEQDYFKPKKSFVILDLTNDELVKEVKMIIASDSKDNCVTFLKDENITYTDILETSILNTSEIEIKGNNVIVVDFTKFYDFSKVSLVRSPE